MVSLSLQCLVEHCRYIHIYSVSTLHTGQTTRTEYSGERIFIKIAFPNHLSQEITLEHFSQQLAQSSPDSTEKTRPNTTTRLSNHRRGSTAPLSASRATTICKPTPVRPPRWHQTSGSGEQSSSGALATCRTIR